MNKKLLGVASMLLSVLILASITTASAVVTLTIDSSDPMLMQMDAKIIETKEAGNNVISKRILFGYFATGSPIEGTINREITVEEHTKTGKVTVQNTVYVTDAVVTVGDREATGEFVMKLSGIIPNVKWVITTSNLVDTETGKPVNLNGQGDSAITYFGAPYNFPETPFTPINYGIENALWGKIRLTP